MIIFLTCYICYLCGIIYSISNTWKMYSICCVLSRTTLYVSARRIRVSKLRGEVQGYFCFYCLIRYSSSFCKFRAQSEQNLPCRTRVTLVGVSLFLSQCIGPPIQNYVYLKKSGSVKMSALTL